MKSFWHLLFLPHEKNNHRAILLQPTFIGIFIAFYLLNQSIIKSLTVIKPGVLGYSSEITIQKVYNETNDQRRKLGLPILHFNPVLAQSAAAKGQDIFANNYWAHNSPQGKTPWDFFKAVGYNYSLAGENLAKDFYDPDSLMKAWMNSPTHRDNIVNTQYQEIGIAVVNGVLDGVETTLVVQHFGTPLDASAVVTNSSIEQNYLQSPKILAAGSVSPKPLVSPLELSKIIGALMFIVIIGVLFVDGYLTLINKTQRLTGSSASHIGFLAIILLLLLFTHQGAIF